VIDRTPFQPNLLQNWDGSGGNGSALRHYEATGKKYPLVVKLGTITPSGADVYSYAADEDDMVTDPHLGRHLAHWGINMMQVGGGVDGGEVMREAALMVEGATLLLRSCSAAITQWK
jgi:hypothetical protein